MAGPWLIKTVRWGALAKKSQLPLMQPFSEALRFLRLRAKMKRQALLWFRIFWSLGTRLRYLGLGHFMPFESLRKQPHAKYSIGIEHGASIGCIQKWIPILNFFQMSDWLKPTIGIGQSGLFSRLSRFTNNHVKNHVEARLSHLRSICFILNTPRRSTLRMAWVVFPTVPHLPGQRGNPNW